ncbi:hypothetical protein CCP3SC1AL1_20031 [Gammaproteobacteria bacterium]
MSNPIQARLLLGDQGACVLLPYYLGGCGFPHLRGSAYTFHEKKDYLFGYTFGSKLRCSGSWRSSGWKRKGCSLWSLSRSRWQ